MADTPTFINPLTDFGFKYIFGNEEHKEFLLSFLNAIFPEEGEIVNVEFVDKEKLGSNKDARALIYDLHCITASGKKIIVEMQNRYQTYFKDRALFYISADLHTQGKRGNDWDYRLTPVYGIFLMNFDWKEFADQQLREDVKLVNTRTNRVFSDKLHMVFLKLPMLNKDAEECRETLERWLYVFKNMETMKSIPVSFSTDPVFKRLGKVAQYANLSEKEQRLYDQSLKIYRDNFAIAQTERAEGRAEGRAEEKRDIAQKLLAAGLDVRLISKTTDLSKEELEKL